MIDAVTGAFSYSGRAIAAELAQQGRQVRTLTGHPERAQPGTEIDLRPLNFDDPAGLVESLQEVTTLYNTYWIRFARGRADHQQAVANSRILFAAAHRAGVQRVVHLSITNPSIDSPFPYFRGKALVEHALAETGMSHAVVRPATFFGHEGVLLNNIAWLLRRFPIFAVGGDGQYRVRAIHVDDAARLCVQLGAERTDTVVDAVGPERPTFIELVAAIRDAVGSRACIVRVPEVAIPVLSSILGRVVHDVLLTGDEYKAMAAGLADTTGPATGQTLMSEWIARHADTLGVTYANELTRHFTR